MWIVVRFQSIPNIQRHSYDQNQAAHVLRVEAVMLQVLLQVKPKQLAHVAKQKLTVVSYDHGMHDTHFGCLVLISKHDH